MPSEMAVAAFERLTDPATSASADLAGYYAIESLRLEKGYRAFGRELSPDTSPVEAGLLFACKLGTTIPFRGREAVEQARPRALAPGWSRHSSPTRADAWGGELLLRDGVAAGQVTSAASGRNPRPLRRTGVPLGPRWRSDRRAVDRGGVLPGQRRR